MYYTDENPKCSEVIKTFAQKLQQSVFSSDERTIDSFGVVKKKNYDDQKLQFLVFAKLNLN